MAQNNQYSTLLFQPFSYERYLAPLMAEVEARQSLNAVYGILLSKADLLRAKAESEPTAKWALLYNLYAKELEDASNNLLNRDLASSKKGLMNLWKNYTSTVDNPLKAIAQLLKLSDYMYQLNPALRMVYGDMPTIDLLIANPELKPIGYSGQDVYTQAATSGKMASARNAVDKFIKSKEFPGYLEHLKSQGFKFSTLADLMKIPELALIVDIVSNQYGNFEGVSEAGKLKLKGEIFKGLMDGASYTESKDLKYDEYGKEMRGYAHDWSMAKWKAQLTAAQNGLSQLYNSNLPIDADEISFGGLGEKANKQVEYLKGILGFKGKTSDGKNYLTSKINIDSSYKSIVNELTGDIIHSNGPVKNKNGSNDFSTIKYGRLMTRDEFASLGAELEDREALRKYYDLKIKPALKALGAERSLDLAGINSSMERYLTNLGATKLIMPTLNFADNKKVLEGKLGSLISGIGGAYTIDGKLENYSSGKRVSSLDILKDIKDNNKPLTYRLSYEKGNEGLVIDTGDTRYFIPKANMSKTVQLGFETNLQKTSLYLETLLELNNNYDYYVMLYGTDEVTKMALKIMSAYKSSGAESFRNLSFGIAGEYNIPRVSTLNTSE